MNKPLRPTGAARVHHRGVRVPDKEIDMRPSTSLLIPASLVAMMAWVEAGSGRMLTVRSPDEVTACTR